MSVLDRIERRIENMRTMLTLYGIDPADFTRIDNGVTFTSAMRACQACPSEALCTAWLARAGNPIQRVPEFCPNARRFTHAKALVNAEAGGRMN
ncbi:MAG: DUF6455 family protein [Pseudomonadota bacterium]|jgi:hypothetical protein